MYNHDYYATLDQAMVKLLKHTALNGLRTLNAIAMYLFMQPIRLCEYIEDCIRMERDSQKETEIRFENLKQNGHI
ncbi:MULTISPECIES: hypothetical protein [Faecalibacterium]|jgi:hypothetical protein|uniref:hypothetical protein n=1 Tax=Faecalibacterium TaxID=216851 RepID=UPI000E4ACE10|nr:MULTISPECIES: hypothetical protein [Faecalibacterium]RHQ28305.1 hypothetical protein DWY95_07195 [Faecalibacterium sp. AF28-13AC]